MYTPTRKKSEGSKEKEKFFKLYGLKDGGDHSEYTLNVVKCVCGTIHTQVKNYHVHVNNHSEYDDTNNTKV